VGIKNSVLFRARCFFPFAPSVPLWVWEVPLQLPSLKHTFPRGLFSFYFDFSHEGTFLPSLVSRVAGFEVHADCVRVQGHLLSGPLKPLTLIPNLSTSSEASTPKPPC